jgi:hypothetical protein
MEDELYENFRKFSAELLLRKKAAVTRAQEELPNARTSELLAKAHVLLSQSGEKVHSGVYWDIAEKAESFEDRGSFNRAERETLARLKDRYGELLRVEVVKTEDPFRRYFQVWIFSPEYYNTRGLDLDTSPLGTLTNPVAGRGHFIVHHFGSFDPLEKNLRRFQVF